MKIKEMDNDLFQFLNLDIPSSAKIEDGFLEIINQQHREVINSRIYSYFLDKKKNRKVANIFLNALLKIIEEKSKKKLKLDT